MDAEAPETDTDIDSDSTDTAHADTSSDAAPSGADSTAVVDSAEAANPTAVGDAGSLASGAEATEQTNEQTQKQPVQAQKPVDWKKSHDGQFQANQRLVAEKKQLLQQFEQTQAEIKQLREQMSGVDVNQVRSFKEHQEKSANPIWHPQNPEHARFQQAKQTHDYYVRMLQRAETPEQKAWINQQYDADVPAEDQKVIQQFLDHGRREMARMQMDPVGYMQERMDKLMDEKIQKFQQSTVGSYREQLQAKDTLGQTLQKYPELNRPEHLQRAMQMVNDGRDMSDALRDIRMELLEKRLSGADIAKKSVEEKERLLSNNASISRDPAVNQNIDVFAEANKIAKARNVKNPWDPRFMRIVDEVRRKYNIKE